MARNGRFLRDENGVYHLFRSGSLPKDSGRSSRQNQGIFGINASVSAVGSDRTERQKNRIEPPPVSRRAVLIPGLQGGFDACRFTVAEIEITDCDGSAGFQAVRSCTNSRFKVNALFLIGREGRLVRNGPDRANRAHVGSLRTEQGVQVQTLGVVQSQLHRFVLSKPFELRDYGLE
jgi:hypothetical protein